MQYVDCLLRHMLAFETKKCERCQARRGHASALDYSRKIPSPEPPSAMVSLALYKMLLLLNQTARETPIINSSTRLSSNLEIKCWTMFKALYTPSLPYTLFASLCSITDSNFFNSWVKVLQTPLRFFHATAHPSFLHWSSGPFSTHQALPFHMVKPLTIQMERPSEQGPSATAWRAPSS